MTTIRIASPMGPRAWAFAFIVADRLRYLGDDAREHEITCRKERHARDIVKLQERGHAGGIGMSDTPRCDKCRHWKIDTGESYRAMPGIGECLKVVMLWEATEWSEDSSDDGPERVVKQEAREQMSFVQDGRDYHASLWTKPEFFCAQFDATERPADD